MTNSFKKNYRRWLAQAVVIALISLLPASLTANSDLGLSDPGDTHSIIVQTATSTSDDKQPDRFRSVIRFPGKQNESGGLSAQFFNALTLEMSDNQPFYWMETEDTILRPNRNTRSEWIYEKVLFDGEKSPRLMIMREQATKAVSHAASETFNATPWGREIKALEEKVAGYFVVGISKNRFESAPMVQFPGETAAVNAKKPDSEYAVSIGSSFYADTDSLQGNYALTVNAIYHDYLCEAEYDFGNDKATISLESERLNEIFDVHAAFSFVRPKEAPATGVISLSWDL